MQTSLKFQLLLFALTLINLGILGVIVSRPPAIAVASETSDGILRGRGLEIIDDQGRVRASITLNPPVKQADGSVYPETVLLRLMTSAGRPIVKLASSEDGAGLALAAAEGDAYAQILARGNDPKLVIVNGAGKEIAKLP